MKKLILVLVVLLIVQKWHTIADFFNPPPDYSLLHSERVILYATSWCSYCTMTRRFLAQNNIPYFEYDIEKSAEGKEQYDSLGLKGVPVMLIDGELVHGYDPEKISRLLNL